MIAFNVFWYLKVFNNENSSYQLQRTLTLFPCIRIIISFLMTYYIILENKFLNNTIENKLYKMYVEIFLQTLISLYRTFFWFILLLLAYGWQIFRNEISQRELKKFLMIYIGIYLLTYFDQILDEVIISNIYGFYPSEYKNFLIFFIFTIIVFLVAKRSYSYLTIKYHYAREFLPQYCQPLLIKMNMLISLIILTIVFTMSYIALVITLKIVIRSTKLLERMSVMIQETVIMIAWLIIFVPRDFPDLFNDLLFDNYNQEFNEFKNTNIYKVQLPINNELFSTNSLNKDINRMKISQINNGNNCKDIVPILIINPIFFDNNNMDFNPMDKLAIAYVQN